MLTDLPAMLALAAVVEEGTFEAAAVRLHVTPSAVSQRVKGLEQNLGQVLVQRTRPCRATEAGQALVRLANQWRLLESETAQAIAPPGTAGAPLPRIALVVNADSLSTWFPPALAAMPAGVVFDVRREDQDHSAELLRAGTVMAAVTTDPRPVQGCRVRALGAMRYVAVAAPSFRDGWFADGPDAEAFSRAPSLAFTPKDALQDQFVRTVTGRSLVGPVHHVPSSGAFVELVAAGLGWGMVPEATVRPHLASGRLVELAPGRHLGVALHWQHWNLGSPTLDELTAHVMDAARAGLRSDPRQADHRVSARTRAG
ncbi:MAG TPA: LysR family transcriptional regulator ArgP [Actinotalea sp.]